MTVYDVIVAGMGPAGSTAAYTLAASGLRVLAIDKERFPRYKSCGGCISVKAGPLLDFDISGCVEDTVRGAVFTYKSGRETEIVADRPVGWNVMRDVFDGFLVEKAREAGAEVLEGVRVKGLKEDDGRVYVYTDDGRNYSGRFVVGADGSGGMIGREYFGLSVKKSAVTITSEVPYDRASFRGREGRLFIDFGCVPNGYAWIFPKKRCLSVGIACDDRRARGRIKEYYNAFISSHGVLKGLKIEERAGWTVPAFYDARPMVNGRALLVGDTGHLVDPFLGEGIYYAMKTAKVASGVVTECLRSGSSDLGAYQAWLDSELYPEFRYAGKLASLVYTYPRLWYSLMERDPGIMQRYYGVVRGEESHREFYGWVMGKIRSKPWKLLRRWFEGNFMTG